MLLAATTNSCALGNSTRALLASVGATALLVLTTGPVHAQLTTPAEPVLTVDQVHQAFTTAGYRVDHVAAWGWTSPPVTSLEVRDSAGERVLMVLVFASGAAAQSARRQARANEPAPTMGDSRTIPGPHLVPGYGPSLWSNNIAIVQTTSADLEHLYQMQNYRDCGINVDTGLLMHYEWPDTAVDVDFQQALQTEPRTGASLDDGLPTLDGG